MEKWRDVKGYENLYQVSSKGRVFNVLTQKHITGRKTADGYRVSLYKKTEPASKPKDYYVSVLVAKAFIPNYANKTRVGHYGDIYNNDINNLFWATPAEINTNKFRKRKEVLV